MSRHHGAVDNTSVQFDPALMGPAAARKTLAPEYLAQKQRLMGPLRAV